MPGGESLVRQSIIGRRFLTEEFGLTPEQLRMCWLPDTFGYTGSLPQILKKSGMDWFQTIKLSWNKVTNFPYRTFHWKGIDGSSVLVHMPPEGEYNSRGAADGLLRGLAQYPGARPGHRTSRLRIRRRRRRTQRDPPRDDGSRARPARTAEGRILHGERLLPPPRERWMSRLRTRGELYLQAHQGTYTTQAHIKRYNRMVERKLHEAEALAAIVGEDCRAALEQHWRDVLLGHFHDILPGSGITRVVREAVESLQRIDAALDEYIASLAARLPAQGRRALRAEPDLDVPPRARLARGRLVRGGGASVRCRGAETRERPSRN